MDATYNYDHFGFAQLRDEASRLIRQSGPMPSEPAPDFELPRVGGGALRLSSLRGRPVLLRFGSPT